MRRAGGGRRALFMASERELELHAEDPGVVVDVGEAVVGARRRQLVDVGDVGLQLHVVAVDVVIHAARVFPDPFLAAGEGRDPAGPGDNLELALLAGNGEEVAALQVGAVLGIGRIVAGGEE